MNVFLFDLGHHSKFVFDNGPQFFNEVVENLLTRLVIELGLPLYISLTLMA